MKSIARHERLRKKCRMLFEKKTLEQDQGDWATTPHAAPHTLTLHSTYIFLFLSDL
jgi:hypothetical protein